MEFGNLIITRRPNEAFQIGEHVTVTILHVQGHRVKISIRAPRDTNIMRTELKSEALVSDS
jgi:carbon storage regulator CsrA